MEYLSSFRDDLHDDIKPSFIVHSFRDEHDAKMRYGLPKVKKFPMPDAKHVRSAIRFFNYAKPSQEQELAKAILARMHEYGIDPSDINVGDTNRFKKYLPQTELKHHGIKGMHWGIKRYQNEDGSRTSLGKRHRKDIKYKNSDNRKKIARRVAGAALAGAAGYALYKTGGVKKVQRAIQNTMSFEKQAAIERKKERRLSAIGKKSARQLNKERIAKELTQHKTKALPSSTKYVSRKTGPSEATKAILDANQKYAAARKVKEGTARIRSNGKTRRMTERERKKWLKTYARVIKKYS